MTYSVVELGISSCFNWKKKKKEDILLNCYTSIVCCISIYPFDDHGSWASIKLHSICLI